MLAVKTDGLCSVPTILVAEENNGLPQLVSDILIHAMLHNCVYTYICQGKKKL